MERFDALIEGYLAFGRAKLLRHPTTPWLFVSDWGMRCRDSTLNTMIQAGGHVLSPDGKKSGFDDPASIQGLEFWTGLIKDKVAPVAEVYTDTDPIQLFQSGKYGMYYGGVWFASTYWANPEIRERMLSGVKRDGYRRVAVMPLGNERYTLWRRATPPARSAISSE